MKLSKTTTRLVFISLAISLVVPIFVPSAKLYAQDTGQALEIGPTVFNLKAKPGETINTTVNLRDVSSGPLVVRGQVNDFTADGEDGNPKVILDEGEESPYSLRSWVMAVPSLTLKPKQVQTLPIQIKVPSNAAPGGYFGVIRFTGTPPELESTGVSLSASLGALIFIQVEGESQEKLSIQELFIDKDGARGPIFEGTPLTFVVRAKNEGNTHQQPMGGLEIKDMFGNKVAYAPINQPPRNILPGTIRKFESQLGESTLGNKKLFGLYTAELTLTYGDNKQTVTQKIQFWVIPWKLILIGIGILVVLFFALKHTVKRYNRYIIKQASKRK